MNLTRVVKDKELLSQTALLFLTLPLPLHRHSWMHGGWAASEMGGGLQPGCMSSRRWPGSVCSLPRVSECLTQVLGGEDGVLEGPDGSLVH